MIAAYVSGLNQCQFCYGGHSVFAEIHGIDKSIFDALFDDLETAPIDDKMRPLLRYVGKLTLSSYKMTQADYDAVIEAGWSEQALDDAIAVVCLFNFFNRLVDGHGLVPASDEARRKTADMIRFAGYNMTRAALYVIYNTLKQKVGSLFGRSKPGQAVVDDA